MRRPRLAYSLSRRIRAVLACGVLLGTGAIGTTALWSTSAATVSGQFTANTLEIKANGVKEYTFAFSGPVYPGYTTEPAVINVQNTGATAFRYSVSVSSSSALGRAMTLKMTANSTCTPPATTPTAQPITASPVKFYDSCSSLAAQSGVETLTLELTMPSSGVPQSVAGTPGNPGTGTVLFMFDATRA